jgi:hypothetical protein
MPPAQQVVAVLCNRYRPHAAVIYGQQTLVFQVPGANLLLCVRTRPLDIDSIYILRKEKKTVLILEAFLGFGVSSTSRRILPASLNNSVNKSLQLDLSWTKLMPFYILTHYSFNTRFNIIQISTPRITKSLLPSGVLTEIYSPLYFLLPYMC